jgi:LPLT family lysophospholipid transporter-like MFS transporter
MRSNPLIAVYSSQALSAFADNALLIIAIALLKNENIGEQIPWLQAGFLLPFILLSPFLGVLADSLAKGNVMLLGNSIKLLGAGMVLFTPLTLIGYAIVGIGAAVYSPAKYGILGQLVSNDKLVRANGWMEGSTLVAILLGVVIGGMLADWSVTGALWLVLSFYALAMLINLFIPKLASERSYQGESVWLLITDFYHQIGTLWRNRDARLSLTGTSLFWAMGSSLRLMLFAWVPVALLVDDNQLPATLMGVVSIGIMLGAGLAAWRLQLQNARLALWGGLALAPLLIGLIFTHHLVIAIILLISLGIAGGWFIVPLNALLQQRGHESIGAGHALAIQNLFENTTMFLAVSLYGLLSHYFTINLIMLIFTTVLAILMLRAKQINI